MTNMANQPNVLDEAPPGTESCSPSAIISMNWSTIPDPLYGTLDPNAGAAPQYIQPAWRFYGHYSNGDEFEFLVQALKQEFLLPELAPYRTPG
jgi:hypothetical protein